MISKGKMVGFLCKCGSHIQFVDGWVPREFYCTTCGYYYNTNEDAILGAIKADKWAREQKDGNK